MFNFACNFLVHQRGFSDTVTQPFAFVVQGTPPWLCAGFTIETGAGVCVCHRQPPGLLVTPPSKLRVGEAFVSQFKTLLEPESSS